MGKYVVKRLFIGAVTLFVLATITFFLMHAVPGSLFSGDPGRLPSNIRDSLTEYYRLDGPLWIQYLKYLWNALRGDFGVSMSHNGRAVSDIIALGIRNSSKLGAVAFCIAVVTGITLGTVAAFSKKRWVNNTVSVVATIGGSVPSFLLAMLLMMVFGVILRWLPIVGLNSWRHYIMPCIALALAPVAMISRLTKTSLIDVMKQDYMVLARGKGTGQVKTVTRHALKNALVPVVTYAGPLLASLMTGSFVIETLFSVPGLGAEFVTSVVNRDYTMIMALIMLYGTIFIIINTITDLIMAALDPRIRLK